MKNLFRDNVSLNSDGQHFVEVLLPTLSQVYQSAYRAGFSVRDVSKIIRSMSSDLEIHFLYEGWEPGKESAKEQY